MSYLLNDPAAFADELTDGFVKANSDLVRRVPGGVARRRATPSGRVAVVIGGGSGHYPAFAGLVGAGLADGAAMGNVFASPSAQQVYSVARSVASGAGVLLSYGNYAGDALNFDLAEARLNAEGIPCRTVRVTDDIVSAPEADRTRRRGIAGDLAVFRAAAWAAEQGRSLDEVHDLAARANEATRSFGVAFSGCTLPGATQPLFTVAPGRMAVGMGIHGEPGIEEQPTPTARELAHLFVGRLLAARPASVPTTRGARVALILNGLGSVKSEELFVVYSTVADLLAEAGAEIVGPEVGEFATSFEMAGVSLTLHWLDEELESAWNAPAYTPAYRKGIVDPGRGPVLEDETAGAATTVPAGASDRSRAVARRAVEAIAGIKRTVDAHVGELGRLDAVAGDGDHGIGMQRGASAALEAARSAADHGGGVGSVLALAGDAWGDLAGGTSGALWGAALRAVGDRIGDDAAPDGDVITAAVDDGRRAILDLGKAEPGDKTMVDALVPFADTLARHVADGDGFAGAWRIAAEAATVAAAATADLLPRMGRARPHAEKSLGTPDPGAVSLALVVTAIADVLEQQQQEGARS